MYPEGRHSTKRQLNNSRRILIPGVVLGRISPWVWASGPSYVGAGEGEEEGAGVGYIHQVGRWVPRYLTVVLRLPYITSLLLLHPSSSHKVLVHLLFLYSSSSPPPLSSSLPSSPSSLLLAAELEKRSHRPCVVAGIPGADFICRMSTS